MIVIITRFRFLRRMPVYCCIRGCATNSKKNRGLTFHGFPKNNHLREIWVDQTQFSRSVGPNIKVCSLHFTESDFLTPRKDKEITRNRLLKNGVFPSVKLPSSYGSKPRGNLASSPCVILVKGPEGVLQHRQQKAVQSPPPSRRVEPLSETVVDRCSRVSKITCSLFRVCIMTGDQLVHLTGFDRDQFERLWALAASRSVLTPCKCNSVSSRDQLLLTLIKLRLNWSCQTLAISFDVERHIVYETWKHWVHILFQTFKNLDASIMTGAQVSLSLIVEMAKDYAILKDILIKDELPLVNEIINVIIHFEHFVHKPAPM